MELTAKEIIEKHIKAKLGGSSQKLRLLSDCEIELAAMKEACMLAFQAGQENMKGPSPGINKKEFINSLFPESK
jgi:hypothetical protein